MFRSPAAVDLFLRLVDSAAPRYQVAIHAYCVLPDRFYLLLTSRVGRLSEFMKAVLGSFTRWAQSAEPTDGPLWRGPYRSFRVDDDDLWMELFSAVHAAELASSTTPEGEGVVRSSRVDYAGRTPKPLLRLERQEFLDLFGGPERMEAAWQAIGPGWRDHLVGLEAVASVRPPELPKPEDIARELPRRRADHADLHRLRPSTSPARAMGGELGEGPWTASTGEAREGSAAIRDPDQAIDDVIQVTGVDLDSLFRYRRHVPNRAAWLAAWWLQCAAGLTQSKVGERMHIAQPGVAQRIRKFQEERDQEPLRSWVEALQRRGSSGMN